MLAVIYPFKDLNNSYLFTRYSSQKSCTCPHYFHRHHLQYLTPHTPLLTQPLLPNPHLLLQEPLLLHPRLLQVHKQRQPNKADQAEREEEVKGGRVVLRWGCVDDGARDKGADE